MKKTVSNTKLFLSTYQAFSFSNGRRKSGSVKESSKKYQNVVVSCIFKRTNPSMKSTYKSADVSQCHNSFLSCFSSYSSSVFWLFFQNYKRRYSRKMPADKLLRMIKCEKNIFYNSSICQELTFTYLKHLNLLRRDFSQEPYNY